MVKVYAEGEPKQSQHESWVHLKWQIARQYFGIAPGDVPRKRLRQKTQSWESVPANHLLSRLDGQLLDQLAGQQAERAIDSNAWIPNSNARMQALGELAGRSGKTLSEEELRVVLLLASCGAKGGGQVTRVSFRE